MAGGGTGDAAIYLAEQLRHTRTRVTYLDISKASMKIAKKRAKIRRLDNIEWVQGSLLDLPRLGLGPFRYINCTGVLHHLEDPSAGLLALMSALEEGGAMGLMVYGKYGRTGIYQIQELMRLVNQGEPDMRTQIRNTRDVLANLPATNWFKRGEELAVDHIRYGDIGLFDLFLHSRDRAFSVPELHDWLASCGLQFTSFSFEDVKYQPAQYIEDQDLLARLSALPLPEQQAIAELLSGAIVKHTFYCAPQAKSPPGLDDEDMVPFLWGGRLKHLEVSERLRSNPGRPVEFDSLYLTINFAPSPYSEPVFRYMDGSRTAGEIVAAVSAEPDTDDPSAARRELAAIYRALNGLNLMFLRHRSVDPFTPEISMLP